LAGAPDREGGRAGAVRRDRDLRRHPAPRRHEAQPRHRRDQQGRGGADLPGRRLRHRRRSVPGRALGGGGAQEMSTYAAPLKDMRFVLTELANLSEVAKLPGCEEATPDTVDAILEEAARFASGVLDPLNRSGDEEGSKWSDGEV